VGVIVDTTGIDGLSDFFSAFPTAARTAMSNAINDTASDFAIKTAKAAILKETAFPPGYLDSNGRLEQTRFATPDSLYATVTGRDRPTSLARFAAPGTPVSSGRGVKLGVTVTVNPDDPLSIPEGFLVNLRGGNVGLAIRLKPGESLRNYSGSNLQAHVLSPNVYLLYAASVDQVFRDVAADISDDIAAELGREFLRRFNSIVNK
jgi:hypothetical protein